MSIKIVVRRTVLLLFVISWGTAMYGLNELSIQENLFLSYPSSPRPSENKIAPISLKGRTFYISPDESKEHARRYNLFYYSSIVGIVLIGVLIKLGLPAKATIFGLGGGSD
jgi:hypothetical protein